MSDTFRKNYRPLNADEAKLLDEIKDAATVLEALYNKVSSGRYRSLGLTTLEESVMWTVKQLTS